jgi:hypothetical protein
LLMRMFLKYIICFVALLVAISTFAGNRTPVIREQHKIIVDGVEENWRLEWIGPTKPACGPEDPGWMNCPCTGFAFGERGNLELVRSRPGIKEERMAIAPLFEYGDDHPAGDNEAALLRWDIDKKDFSGCDAPDFPSRVRARPVAKVMNFGDYDHDGRTTEFILQIGTLPCGKRMSVVVGISRRKPHLHAFSTVEHPEKPLILRVQHWESLLQAKGPIRVIDWLCGDHASETETELELRAKAGRIHVKQREYTCPEKGQRKQLIKEKVR